MVNPTQAERPGSDVGGAVLGEILGAGWMGVVYACRHPTRGPGAIKILRPRFARHAAALVPALAPALQIAHPALVPVRAVGPLDDTVYIEMVRVDAPTLEEALATDGPLTWPQAVQAVSRVAAALAILHTNGWIHGDIKPDNVVGSKGGETVLLDWLDARVAAVALQAEGSTARFGTPHYMAPEIVRRARADGRADVYGLGLMLVDLLTGETAIQAEDPAQAMQQQLDGVGPLPKVAGLPTAVAALWTRMVAPDPSDRPTAAEVAAAL